MNPRDFEPTRRPPPAPGSPPPPDAPRKVDQQALAALTVFGGAGVAAVALLVPGTWGEYYATRLWLPLWAIGCLVFGGALLEHRSRWVARISRVSRHRLVDWGGGAYGAIALCCFAWSELEQLRETGAWLFGIDWSAGRDAFREAVQGAARNLADFVVGSVMNGLHAFVWPAFWRKSFDAGMMWPAVLVGWGVFESARYAVKQLATAPAR